MIGSGGAEPRLRRRRRRRVGLSISHVEPHLVIVDMAAGQKADPFKERIHLAPPRSRSPDPPTQRGGESRFFPSLSLRSGSALPSAQPWIRFPSRLSRDSHLDYRGASC
jgi:hypothetical protein